MSITLKNIVKAFDRSPVVKNFNEVFEDGEFITLLGPSGCGKTTILRMIAGFERPTSGEIWIDDQLVSSDKTMVPPEKRGIGMVFQSYAVWPHMTVYDNVAYPLTIKHVDKETIKQRVEKMLKVVHLTDYATRLPSQLSGGQQQRVALARALVMEPKLLLLDEPLSNLDAKLRETMRFEIKDIAMQMGIGVVYVTHDQTEAMAMSDRIFLINNGIVQQSGSPEEIYNRPVNQFVADFLGKVQFFKGTAENGKINLTTWHCDLDYPEMTPSGAVEVAIRPENISLSRHDHGYNGVIEKKYYLGDTTDLRIRVGEELVRVIEDGFTYNRYEIGDSVHMKIHDYIVFEDAGDLAEQLMIRT